MKVGIFLYGSPCSAAATRLRNMAKAIKLLGADPILVIVEPNFGSTNVDHEEGIATFHTGVEVRGWRKRLPALSSRRAFDLHLRNQLLGDDPIDVAILYGASYLACTGFIRSLKGTGVKLLCDVTEFYPWKIRRLFSPAHIDHRLFLRCLSKIDGVIAISHEWFRIAKKYNGNPVLIPSFANQLDCVAELEKQDGKRFKLVYLGPLSPRDLPETLIQSVIMARAGGVDLELVVVGKVDSQRSGRAAMERVRKSSELKGVIRFTGWVTDDQRNFELSTADALILLRKDDQFSRACFPTRLPEYLLTQKPVILSAVGGIEEYFQNFENACLVSPGHCPREISNVLKSLIQDRALAKQIGLNGFETALESFGLQVLGERLMNFIEELKT